MRNVGPPGALTISLTHNFVDASNLCDVLHDATRSISEELLPMARSLKPRSVRRPRGRGAAHVMAPGAPHARDRPRRASLLPVTLPLGCHLVATWVLLMEIAT